METLPAGARLETGPGGLERLVLSAPDGEALVYLHGAHVAHFQPMGERPVLWMSAASRFEAGRPIRGGVPVCFPWFGPKAGSPDAPIHGFARLRTWSLAAVANEDDVLRARLDLAPEAAAASGFAGDVALWLDLSVGRTLTLRLGARNTGAAAVSFEAALHSYFAVSDVRQVAIRGLEDAPYLDKTAGMTAKPAAGEPITVSGETDRVYAGAAGPVTIDDPTWRRRIVVGKEGSRTTVVWNPWIAKAKAMPDFGDEEWPGMLCVETANVADDALTLAPGETHVMTARLEVRAG